MVLTSKKKWGTAVDGLKIFPTAELGKFKTSSLSTLSIISPYAFTAERVNEIRRKRQLKTMSGVNYAKTKAGLGNAGTLLAGNVERRSCRR